MKLYLLRSFKYIVKMAILLGALFVLMSVTGTSAVSGEALFNEIFLSTKGLLLIGALLVVAATYPKFGFVKRDVRANMAEQRQNIINLFDTRDYVVTQQDDTHITFRAKTTFKRIMLSWDDEITVSADGNYVTISGIRKEVVRIVFLLNPYLKNE